MVLELATYAQFLDDFEGFIVLASHSNAWISRSGKFRVHHRQTDRQTGNTDYTLPLAYAVGGGGITNLIILK